MISDNESQKQRNISLPNKTDREIEKDEKEENHENIKIEKFDEKEEELILGNYRLGKTIGEGTFGKVKIGYHKMTGEKVNYKYY
jgi:serine/threonine protein kinase